MRCALVIASLFTVVTTGCFVLERAAALTAGTVRGEARFGGEGRDGVVVELGNSRFSRRTASDGGFLIDGLDAGRHALRFSDDDDDDGIVDRGAAVDFFAPALADGVAGVDLGPVDLRGTVTVSGTIRDDDGGGLDDVVVVVTRFALDQRAEVIAAVSADDDAPDDGVVSFSLRGVVPGAIEVQAFGRNGRASNVDAFVLGDDADRDDVELGLVAAPAASVIGRVTPSAPTTTMVVVPVDAGPRATPVTSARVGVEVDVPAGVYDVWFFLDDVLVAGLPRQVARPDVDNLWGPAQRGALSGLDGTENTRPVVTGPGDPRLLVTLDGAASIPVPFDVVDPDGDPTTVTAVQPDAPLTVVLADDGTALTVSLDADADIDAVLFARVPIEVEVDDGKSTTRHVVATAIVADGVFVGGDPGEVDSWLSGTIAIGFDARSVIEGSIDAVGDRDFLDLDVIGEVQLRAGRLTVQRLHIRDGGVVRGGVDEQGNQLAGELLVGGVDNSPAFLEGRVEDVSVALESTVTFGDVNIIATTDEVFDGVDLRDNATLTVAPGASAVYVQVPFVSDSATTITLRGGGVIHFTDDVTIGGSVDVDEDSGFAFGFFDDVPRFNLLSLPSLSASSMRGTISMGGGGGSRFTMVSGFGAARLKVGGTLVVEANQGEVTAREVLIEPGARIEGQVGVGELRVPDVLGSFDGRVDGTVTIHSNVQLGVGGEVRDGVGIVEGAVLHFGPGTSLSTSSISVNGTLALDGDGRLVLTGEGESLIFGNDPGVTTTTPHNHRLVFSPDGDGATVAMPLEGLGLEDVEVVRGDLTFIGAATVVIDELIVAAGVTITSFDTIINVTNGCSGDGASTIAACNE